MSVEPLILLIEDEPPMRRFLRAALDLHPYRLIEADSARQGLAMAASHAPDVILLDLGLPDGDGIEVTRQLRTWATTPVIVLSARGLEADKVAALDAGADDYLTKPFSVGELLARIRVALRHASSTDKPDSVIIVGALAIDLGARVVRLRGKEIHLTPTEYKLLATLARHLGKVLTHRQLINDVWGRYSPTATQALRVHMTQLRHKIEESAARPTMLITEPGVGYRLKEPDQ